MSPSLDELRFPLGQYAPPASITERHVQAWIDDLASHPANLRRTVEPLTEEQLGTPYRPEGWTVRQVVHHLGDSHINSFARFKLALTEDHPTIKPFDEALWATLPDYSDVPIPVSLNLLDALHERWVGLLRGLSWQQFQRTFDHPEIGTIDLAWTTGMYSWHGRHHVAHIEKLIEREGWKR